MEILHKKLNAEQCKLIEDYLSDNYVRAKKCIYATTRCKFIPKEEMEEFLCVADEALVKAAFRFKSNKGMTFNSFANMNIASAIKSSLTYNNRNCRRINKVARHLEEPLADGLCLSDLLAVQSDMDIQEYERINNYLSTLSDDAKNVLKLRMLGYEVSEISDRLGYSRKYIGELIASMRKYNRVNILRRESK